MHVSREVHDVADGTPHAYDPGDGDVAALEAAAAELHEIWDRALEELGNTLPAGQLRALLVIDRFGALSLNALAAQLHSSTSAASRLCDRLRQGGFIVRTPATHDRRGVVLSLSEAGARLVQWTREQRRSSLARVIDAMRPDDREALLRGLREFRIAAGRGE